MVSFDNVIARFHSCFKKENIDGFTGLYEKTYEGFNEYCAGTTKNTPRSILPSKFPEVSEPIPFFWHDYPDYFDDDARNAAEPYQSSYQVLGYAYLGLFELRSARTGYELYR
eukprot:scaffold421377_cov55-Attheya_sp.AAC.4